MTGTDILGIGTSALLSYQQALQTTSNNISNANTPGYVRERADFATRPDTPNGDYYLGNGVQVSGVQRIVSQFVNAQVANATAANNQYQAYSQYANQVDNLLGSQSAGLQPALQSFYNAVQGVANVPASIPARQELLSQGGVLAGRFNTLYQQFNQIGGQINAQLNNDVSNINSLATQIANLNTQVMAASNNNPVGQPNSLLDKRDAAINQLAKYVSVNTVPQSDGSINVTIGTGQALVVGSSVTRLGVAPANGDPNRPGLVFVTPNGHVPVSTVVTSGELGGLLQSQKLLTAAENGLGRIAIGIGTQFNTLQKQGIDLNGQVGTDFFKVPQPQVFSASSNASGSGLPTVSITDPSQLTADNYRLSYNGSAWTLTNTTNGQNVSMSGSGTTTNPYTAGGLSIVVPTTVSAGDSYTIEPTTYAARDLALNLTDPRQIAAASVVASAANQANVGTATISQPTLTTAAGSVNTTPVTITISGNPPNTWTAISPASNTTLSSGSYSQTSGATIALNGWSVDLSGGAKAGDSFDVTPPGPGDNGNALQMAASQQQNLLENGGNGPTATFGAAYSQLVAKIGTETQTAQTSAQTNQALLKQATSLQQSLSGVNLDQEAANLLKYQQAYQASAKVIATANSLFQTLLQAVQ